MAQCAQCQVYKEELSQAEVQSAKQGKNWYKRRRSTINHRATMHKNVFHPDLEKLDALIQTKQAEFNRLLQERNEKNEKKERERLKSEKEEREERHQEERRKRRRF